MVTNEECRKSGSRLGHDHPIHGSWSTTESATNASSPKGKASVEFSPEQGLRMLLAGFGASNEA
jgi:hypothetical protein